jgi:NADH-quinone oxidoreductase subunit I
MYGKGILKGLSVTWKRFWSTYTEDIAWMLSGRKRYFNQDGVKARANYKTRGIFTVQYPEEQLTVPEEFRYIPFLVYDEGTEGKKEVRCTSCGICAKVCPPQCIWIVRTNDPATGRPVPVPTDFYIDADICMNCGFCAEYCPFDAIKMDHEIDIATYSRNVHNIDMLLKPASYYASVRPQNAAREDEARRVKEAAKAAKAVASTA